MSKYRRAARIDDNQNQIVAGLRMIPGVTVATRHDDILVGYRGRTYWFEIKDPAKVLKKRDGGLRKGALKESQEKLEQEWTGHFEVVWSIDMILKSIGINSSFLPRQ